MQSRRLIKISVILISLVMIAAGCLLIISYKEGVSGGYEETGVKDTQYAKTTKDYYDETIPVSTEKEQSGIVHKGYILKHLRENEWGWNLPALCNELGIKMVVQEDKYQIYKEWKIPVNFYVEKDDIRLTFKGVIDENSKVHINAPYMAAFRYRVYKNNKEIKMKNPPITYRAGGPNVDLEEFLKVLEIDYFKDGSTIYLYSNKRTDIKGKVMHSQSLELDTGESVRLRLIYNYKGDGSYDYKNIELHTEGDKDLSIQVFSEEKPGNLTYYKNGSIYCLKYNGERFIQLILDCDTVVYKYTENQFVQVFDNSHYEKYAGANLFLETGELAKCTFVDEVNGIRKRFKDKDVKPNSIYSVRISYFSRMEQDMEDNKLKLVANAGAVSGGRYIFTIENEFIYDGERFAASRIYSTDWSKFDADKRKEKKINSIDNYRIFEYSTVN